MKNIIPKHNFRKFIIDYKTLSLVATTNTSPQKNNVVYHLCCPLSDCVSVDNEKTPTYIGYTTAFLMRRLICHLFEQTAIYKHLTQIHGITSHFYQILVNNTKVLSHSSCKT